MTDSAKLTATDVATHVGNATGELGFLKWVETLPAAISEPVLKVAAAHAVLRKKGNMAGLGLGLARIGRLKNSGARVNTFGLNLRALGALGQSAMTDQQIADATGLSLSDLQAGELDTGSTTAAPAATTVATSTPASTSWLSDIGSALTSAVQAAGTAYLTVNQVQGANQILNTNLQRAQQGLPPLPYTASQLGLTGPTVNLGLSSTTLTPLLLLGGGALLIFALIGAAKRS